MSNNPSISVIMGVFNCENDLDRGIMSILNQTFSDFEFIICDDGSSDKTFEKLLNYKRTDDRVIILRNEKNMGLAYSLNRCIEVARSNILARQDVDDVSLPNRFEIQYPFVIAHPEYSIVGTSWFNVDQNGNEFLMTPLECPTAKQMVWGGSYMHPSWMMRKDDLSKIGYYTVNKYTRRDQDYYLVMKLLSKKMKLYNLRIPLYKYTANEKTYSRTKSWKTVKGLMWIRFNSYKENKLPFWCYFAVFKPLIKNALPSFITRKHYNKKMNHGK